MTHKIIYHRVAGILPAAVSLCNTLGLAKYAIQFLVEPNFATMILKVPDEKVVVCWRKLGRDMHHCPVDPLKIIESSLA